MNCPNCNEIVEVDAAFCGNCGQALKQTAPQSSLLPEEPHRAEDKNAEAVNTPAYALAQPSQHKGDTKALLALLFGIAGLVSMLLMALPGLVFGITGIVMGTMSRSGTKRKLSTAGLVVSSLAVLSSLGVLAYVISKNPVLQKSVSDTTSQAGPQAILASGLSTPCYSTGFVDKLNVSNSAQSCDMSAFNGKTLGSSTNAYRVYASKAQLLNDDFIDVAKPALDKDIASSLPGFVIDNERAGKFAGSPAYIVNASSKKLGVAVAEAAVLHQVGNGENVFILVHAVNNGEPDFTTLEAQWQWK